MKNNIINEEAIRTLKTQRSFRRGDIFVYAALAALIAALFWAFVFARPKINLGAINVFHDDPIIGETLVFQYSFASDSYTIDDAWTDRVHSIRIDGGYTVRFDGLGDSADGFNLLTILDSGEAFMLDADCSRRKDCVGFAHIRHGGSVIICVPHQLTVVGEGGVYNEEPGEDPDGDVDLVLG